MRLTDIQMKQSSAPRIVTRRTRGNNNNKVAFKTAEFANVVDHDNKNVTKSKILRVTKNPANRDYERRGVISRGAIIEIETGQQGLCQGRGKTEWLTPSCSRQQQQKQLQSLSNVI